MNMINGVSDVENACAAHRKFCCISNQALPKLTAGHTAVSWMLRLQSKAEEQYETEQNWQNENQMCGADGEEMVPQKCFVQPLERGTPQTAVKPHECTKAKKNSVGNVTKSSSLRQRQLRHP